MEVVSVDWWIGNGDFEILFEFEWNYWHDFITENLLFSDVSYVVEGYHKDDFLLEQ